VPQLRATFFEKFLSYFCIRAIVAIFPQMVVLLLTASTVAAGGTRIQLRWERVLLSPRELEAADEEKNCNTVFLRK
jgi:hypothetical protein